jgi:hypothetical protein
MAIDLDALEKLAAQATPGPWEADMLYNIVDEHGILVHTFEEFGHTTKPSRENVRYIVAACNAVPELIAENRALRERVRELERQREILAHRLADASKIRVKAYSAETWIELAEIAAKEAWE